MKEQIEFFNRKAENWEEENPVPEEKLREVIEFSDLSPGQKVLDVGTGTGRLVPYILAQIGCEGKLTAVDPASGMLRIARKNHKAENLQFVRAKAENLSLPSRRFHRVICYAVYPHFEDKKQALHNLARVLKPKGRLIIAHTESRHSINHTHRHAGPAVADDKLPPASDVIALCEKVGLRGEQAIDSEELYFVAAFRPQISEI